MTICLVVSCNSIVTFYHHKISNGDYSVCICNKHHGRENGPYLVCNHSINMVTVTLVFVATNGMHSQITLTISFDKNLEPNWHIDSAAALISGGQVHRKLYQQYSTTMLHVPGGRSCFQAEHILCR